MKIVKKLWGIEKWIINTSYCGKILELKKGSSCSLHYHVIKDEHFYIISGIVKMEYGNKIKIMKKGDHIHIFPCKKHRFTGIQDSIIIEFSTTHYDYDSYRLEGSKK